MGDNFFGAVKNIVIGILCVVGIISLCQKDMRDKLMDTAKEKIVAVEEKIDNVTELPGELLQKIDLPDLNLSLPFLPSLPSLAVSQDPSRPAYGLGSCDTLSGRVCVVAFFLDDSEARWTEEEMESVKASFLKPGIEYVMNHASLYNQDLTLSLLTYPASFDGFFSARYQLDASGDPVPSGSLGEAEAAVLQTIARNLGYKTAEKMHKAFQDLHGDKQIAYIVLPKKPGYNYSAVARDPDYNDLTEYMVLYPQDVYGDPQVPNELVYHLLSLFGAGFSNESVNDREPTYSVAARLYPYSAMFGGKNAEHRFLDPYTAYAVGWIDTLPRENAEKDRNLTETVVSESYRNDYNKGTCRTLTGEIAVVTIFVDDNESSWSREQAETFQHEFVTTGLDFLTKQAAKWGHTLTFQPGMYFTQPEQGISVRYPDIMETSASSFQADVADYAAMSLGFPSKTELYHYVRESAGTEQVIILFALNKTGRSFAVSDHDTNANDTLEYCVVFRKNWDTGKKEAAAIVPHEILHLFGAEDLYKEPTDGSRAGKAKIAKKHFPKDVMFQNNIKISSNNVDAFTAYAVGWSNTLPEVCLSKKWLS